MALIDRLEERIGQLEAQIRTLNLGRGRVSETTRTDGCTNGCTGSCPDPTGDCTYNCTHGCTNGCTSGCGAEARFDPAVVAGLFDQATAVTAEPPVPAPPEAPSPTPPKPRPSRRR